MFLLFRDWENIKTNSNHPLKFTSNIFNNLVDRGITLAHKSFHTKNIQKIKMTLIKNNYLRKIIKTRIHEHQKDVYNHPEK